MRKDGIQGRGLASGSDIASIKRKPKTMVYGARLQHSPVLENKPRGGMKYHAASAVGATSGSSPGQFSPHASTS
ncbi:hypothetical protein O1611_g780 [Lasiodiplodia mahajangana]|uniref:Uncharacterized protein n=1 Tax=Lasiodiplodia mahajangana TaxID=1108764 RepID=A0ACC2JZK7_9PEZI|nr:hypothetical protein O1611_g780 [Lasiodiplodia mahajangana]